ncbi:IS1182 family transposase [Paenibacillus sp. V4I7]|uniref:IS1182 family transposase n=1 Tax=Paenibacillus sp. V4I7 TaxID=3042307 RepID=UPI002786402B|nr:IS1182 family transposase [Paenibacillus sp. V4I7]MDQ0901075.1 transposase [Paenibacillus sp. V4I7]
MLHSDKENPQMSYEMVYLDELVPDNHLVRLLQRHIDFSFITDKVKDYYHPTHGRPSIDPIRLFKMMLIGYLFGVRSERQLEQDIIVNNAYRWFLGLSLRDPVPHHSTISWNRHHRFPGSVFQDVFDEVVRLAISHRMVAGRLLVTDSTHMQASANINKYTMQELAKAPSAYLEELEQAVNEERKKHGQKELAPDSSERPKERHIVSKTDPDSGYMKRKGKPEGFFYLEHRTVDAKFNIITDSFVTPGNVNDSTVYIDRLQRQQETFGWQENIEAVILDSGYKGAYVCKKLEEMSIMGVIAPRKIPARKGIFSKEQFTYDADKDVYRCPANQEMIYYTTERTGEKIYHTEGETCKNCPLFGQCTASEERREMGRHVWEVYKEHVTAHTQSEVGRQLYAKRKETIERSFAESKELYGLRRCRFRGRKGVQEQTLMTSVAQNLKRIARYLARLGGCICAAPFRTRCSG